MTKAVSILHDPHPASSTRRSSRGQQHQQWGHHSLQLYTESGPRHAAISLIRPYVIAVVVLYLPRARTACCTATATCDAVYYRLCVECSVRQSGPRIRLLVRRSWTILIQLYVLVIYHSLRLNLATTQVATWCGCKRCYYQCNIIFGSCMQIVHRTQPKAYCTVVR